jgi:photosystem II stability/assembly factor-like uncharacterized protein
MMKKRLILGLSLCLLAVTAVFTLRGPLAERWAEGYETEEDEAAERAREQLSRRGAAEIERMIRLKPGQTEPDYLPGYQMAEYLKAQQAVGNFRTEENLPWRERGPGNYSGRARCVLVDVADVNQRTWLVGSASGGIWRSTDAGASWANVTPNVPNLAISTIAQSPANARVMYAGTGEGAFGGGISGINGSGMLKSTDGGLTWQILPSTVPSLQNQNFLNVNRIIVDPRNENILVAATSNGSFQRFTASIMRSEDGGNSWQRAFAPNAFPQQVIAAPSNFNRQYATINFFGIARSDDAGRSWRMLPFIVLADTVAGERSVGRTELAISPVNPNRLYASMQFSGTTTDAAALFTSDDGGNTWRQMAELGATSAPDYLGGQGDYNNSVVADPFNENVVYWGGVELYRGEVQPGNIRDSERGYLGVDDSEVSQFFLWTRVTGWGHWGGQMQIRDFSRTSPIEVRFGRGRRQRAHRFVTRTQGSGAGVPVRDYVYRDYVDVPFEVWDTDRNRQVMISFRDQEGDGRFNLNQREANDQALLTNREYLYIHNVAYNPTTPNPRIATDGGQEEELVYSLWPYMNTGQTWNPDNFPDMALRIVFGRVSTQGANISQLTRSNDILSIHVDHHQLATIVTDRAARRFRLISVNDGGLAYSDDAGGTWLMRDRGMNTNQFYTAIKRQGANEYIGGVQDGNPMRSGPNPDANGAYTDQNTPRNFADGFAVAWNYRNPQLLLASNQYNRIVRSTDGGNSYQVSVNGLTDACSNLSNCGGADTLAPFFTKLANSDRQPDLVLAVSRNGVWRSTNFGQNWTNIRLTANQGWGGFLDVEVSDADPNIVWAGGSMITGTTTANSRFLWVSNNGGTSFSRVQNFSRSLGNITALVPDPSNAQTCYALFSQSRGPKILRTTNLGQSWEDLSGFGTNETSSNGFPDVAVYSLLAFPDRQTIWVGTEIGLFESTNNGTSWRLANNGLPAVHIWDMKVRDGQVVVATHGRGIWTVDLLDRFANSPLSVLNPGQATPFKLYPNPVRDKVFLEVPARVSGPVEVTLLTTLGQRVFGQTAQASGRLELDLSNHYLPPGTYVVQVASGREKFVQKVVVER